MPFEPNENNRSLTPTGNKVFPSVDSSSGTDMPISPSVMGPGFKPFDPNPHNWVGRPLRAVMNDVGEAARNVRDVMRRK